jgi:small subunit ribosomal protein S13
MRIVGIDIPDKKKVAFALPYIYGIGKLRARVLLTDTKIDPDKRTKDLTQDEVSKIKQYIESKGWKVEGELRTAVRQHITMLKDILAYRGVRHMKHLPVRGQRTKTNSRTIRGNVRKTAGSGKRKTDLK